MKNNTITLEFISIDDWGNPIYKCIENNNLYKDITLGKGENPELYSCGNEIDGEPCYPIKEKYNIVFKTKYTESPYKFNYMMLSRLESDCKYYLGYGNRYKNHLYYKDEQEHIDEMKKLYNSFPDSEKPEWLTWEQLLEYENNMINKTN